MLVSVRRTDSFDYPLLHDWLKLRGVDVKDEEIAPYGWVAFIHDEPVAMLFLRRTDHIAYIEGMTTNPNKGQLERHLAMDNLILNLMNWAKENGIKQLIGYSYHDGILERARRWGFQLTNQTLFSLKMGE